MLKKIMMASIAVGALALNAPAAVANSHLGGDCGFNALQQDDLTGQTYQGGAYGYGTNSNGGDVTVRCDVRVNGVTVSSTPTGGPTPGVATTAGPVSFTAGENDDVDLCAVVSDPATGEEYENCGQSSSQEIPPQEFWDALDGALWTFWGVFDPLFCPQLATYGPSLPAPFSMGGPNGEDLYLDGELWFDCPPYEPAP